MWWRYAKVGQKVTPVDDRPWSIDTNPELKGPPALYGRVYEISEIEADGWMDSGVGIALKELPYSGSFNASDFRPVVDDKRIARRVAEIIRQANAPVKVTEQA